ncbi:MAG: lytic murein transglycosylase B [Proteobacteria bacterium]|nr:lytic murein transglycosylase B [Pseudomonadota bacterium]NOG60287.1 lytic murein transglycosylase B [Pseudomonadota bacterium]
MYKLNLLFSLFVCLSINSVNQNALATPTNNVSVSPDEFIAQMVERHGFDKANLSKILNQTVISQTILDAISRPAEKKLTWFKYRQIFIKDKRINQGVEFMQNNESKLAEAEKKFGVPAEIITAIIGVETFYGRIAGSYRVVDALNTLAFHYPKRADFFRSEFEQFLLLTREQGFDPNSLKGSYAGAMGMPQFISSSYRHYAIDFDGDDVIDIWNNPDDAIGSVANYFYEHGWSKGKPVTVKVKVEGNAYKQALKRGLAPDINSSDIKKFGIITNSIFEENEKLKLFEYEQEKDNEYWLAHNNFYVITRYNHSHLYAMAVYQLAMEIKERLNKNKVLVKK